MSKVRVIFMFFGGLASVIAIVLPALAEQPRLKIGFNISLTGPLAEFGLAIQNGVMLAKEDYPEIEQVFLPIFEDSAYDSKKALNNFEKFRAYDKVDAIYVFGGPMTDVIAPLAERHSLPTFSTEYDTRYTRNKTYVIRFANNASDYAIAVLRTLRAHSASKFAIVKMENQYHNTLSSAFIDSITPSEYVEVLHNFLPTETDFRSVFPALRAGSYDAIGIYILPGAQHAFFAQARSAGVKFPSLFGSDTFESESVNRGIESVVEGAIFANSFVKDSFRQKYLSRFDNVDQLVHAALAYEFSRLLKDIFGKRPRPSSPLEFIQAFELSSGRESVCGEYFFRSRPDTGKYFSFPLAVREVKSGTPKIITTYDAP